MKKLAKWFDTPQKCAYWVIAVIVLIIVFFMVTNHYTPNTDDATVQAYVIPISTVVEGRVIKVYVKDNQSIKKGQPIFEIDPRPYQYAFDSSKTNLAVAKTTLWQMQTLYDKGTISESEFLQAKNDYARAKSAYDQANYNLEHVIVKAPDNGYITNLQVREGAYASVGEAMMTFVDGQKWWVNANFKENNLGRIKPGQLVLLSVNLYPGKIVKTRVNSIGWGVNIIGAENPAKLPTVIKTNNWISLAQRFPVHILISEHQFGKPLRVGATAIVTVLTSTNGFLNSLGYLIQLVRTKVQYFY